MHSEIWTCSKSLQKLRTPDYCIAVTNHSCTMLLKTSGQAWQTPITENMEEKLSQAKREFLHWEEEDTQLGLQVSLKNTASIRIPGEIPDIRNLTKTFMY